MRKSKVDVLHGHAEYEVGEGKPAANEKGAAAETRFGDISRPMDARFLALDLFRHALILGAPRFQHPRNCRIEDAVADRLPPLRLPVPSRVFRRERLAVDVIQVMHYKGRFEKIIARLDFQRRY